MAPQPPPPARYELLRRQPGVADHETKIPVLGTSALEVGRIEAEDTSSRYRILPLFSGVVVPFSILLAIPSVTGRWYVRAQDNGVVIESRPNPWLLQLSVISSLVCGVLANVCLVVRFAERRVKVTTLLAIAFLTTHDVLNVVTLSVFGIQGRVDDGFTYGQPFWMTVCSTIISTTTNIALVVDYFQTRSFATKGSGLTHKQRTLVVISIVLLTYIAFGALVQSFMLKLSFIDALYFTVATIETVGFGDILPTSTGSRVFTMFYITFGILHIAAAVSYAREALLEGIVLSLQHRIAGVHRKERDRRVHSRWRDAVQWRLRAQGSQLWIDRREPELVTSPPQWSLKELWKRFRLGLGWEAEHDHNCEGLHRGGKRRRLHLEALSEAQLHAAALEAGTELHKVLPADYISPSPIRDTSYHADPGVGERHGGSQAPLTVTQGWGMGGLLSSFARRVGYGGQAPEQCEWSSCEAPSTSDRPASSSLDGPDSNLDADADAAAREGELRTMVTKEEKLAFRVRLGAAVAVFLAFWLVGSVLFSVTEKWPFGMAVYFCFVTFTTVGYGDLAPRTPAGRSIFVAWALLGIAAMTILLAILTEAYSSGYKQVVHYEDEVLLASEAAIATSMNDSEQGLASAKTLVGFNLGSGSGGDRGLDKDHDEDATGMRKCVSDLKRKADEALRQGDLGKMRKALEDISRELAVGPLNKRRDAEHDGILG